MQAAAAEDEYSMATLTTWLLKVLCRAASGLLWPCNNAGFPLRPKIEVACWTGDLTVVGEFEWRCARRRWRQRYLAEKTAQLLGIAN